MKRKQNKKWVYHFYQKIWVVVELSELSLPQYIKETAMGHLILNKNWPFVGMQWLREVREHKPKHTIGKRKRFYYVGEPEARPLIIAK